MTSTVVGAAILSAIATGSRCLMDSVQRHEGEKHLRKVRTSPLQITPMNHKYLHHQLVLDLGASDDIPIARLRELALTSVYICKCEGQTLAQRMQLLVCQDCNHQVCTGCAADTPKHNYKSLVFNERRFNPETFLRVVIRTLPMRLEIRIFSQKDWDELKAKVKEMKLPEKEWELLEDCMMNVLGQEHRYQSAKRSFSWKITYDAAFSKLELHFVNNNAYWLLFAKPLRSDPVNSHVRELLKYPIARMSVGFDNVLEGSWEFCLPVHHKFSISITSCGGSADSWEKNFGLESKKYIDKKVPTTLEISGPRFPDAGILEDTLARPIQGLYDLCNDCDAASASLYKKRRGQDEDDILPLFLFLDPERARSEAHDGFVFSTNVNRLNYGDTRDTIAKIHPEWKPDHQLGKGTLTRDGAAHGTWIKFNARLEEKKIYKPVTYAFPRFTALEAPIPVFKRISPAPSSTPLGPTPFDCMNAVITLLACKVPSTMVDGKYWKSDEWTQINLRNERHFAMAFSWLIARAKDCPDVSLKWKKLALPKKFHRCTICAPEPPKIKWKLKPTKVAKIAPYEDVHEAAVFERAMKARPAPFVIRTRVDEEANGRVCVGFNLATLAHRALERFTDPTGVNGKGGMRLSWRIDSEWDLPSSALPKFSATLENNKDSEEAHHIFPGTNMALRPEQRRSLHWMISQEAPVPTPFFEAEIEEAILPHLGWRVEVKAEKSRQIRGGVSADKVGYGKTVTTLALIDHQMKPAENHAKQSLEGCIPVKATLIAVPNTLVSQWEDESKRFLGSSYNILIIPDNKKHPTIKEIMEAHIIIISWNVFGQPSYQKKLSDFAALPEGPPAGGRQHEVFLKRALASIKTHTEELKNTNPGVLADDLDRRLQEARDDVELVFDVPSKRLTGAKYAAEARNATAKGLLSQTKPKTDAEPKAEASHFKYMRVKHGMKAVPVHVWHMFSFYRIVVDEYTYVDGKQYATLTSLHTVCRWALSGTPPLDDFNDIRRLAGFLAINLGDEDDDPVSASDNSIGNSRARRTDAENFRALGSIHTQDWHIGRHAHAQAFLDQFVRQNVAEISELSSSTHLCTVFLHQPEILINLELQIQLQQTDMHIVLASQKKKAGDRYKRINELLRGCGSAEEALLKCCSYFDVPATQNNGTTAVADICEDLIRTRRLDYEDHENVCRMQLEHMTWLRKQIQRSCSRKISDVHYNVWKRHLEKHGVGDPRVSNFLVEVIQDAQARAESEQYNFPLREFYRPKPTAVEEKEELLMDKKRKEQEKRQRKTERQMRARLEKDTRTHDANAVIWKKEDIQKKLETDRKVKKAKKAKKAREDSDREMEENSDTESDEEVPQPMSQQEVIPAKDLRDIEIPQNDFLRYEQASRSGTAELRRLTTEFVARSRAYRFIEAAHMLQKEAGNDVTGECDACHREISVSGRKLRLNILCGHLICDECGKDIECSVDGCKSNAEEYRMRNAEQLRGNSDRSLRFGSKVDAIIRTIEDQDDDDQFLLFIQFEDLISKIAGALTEAGITNYAIKTTSGIQGVADMRDFQTNINNSGENRKKRVLILNSSNQSAAGA